MINGKTISELTRLVSEENDEGAFAQLIRHFFPGLLSFSANITQDRHVSEEIVEDVLVKLWESRNILLTINNLANYLYTAVKHTSINYLKSKSYRTARMFDMPADWGDADAVCFKTPDLELISKENLKAIADVINTLPPKTRLVFRLIKEEGMKYSEVAQLLAISPKTVNTHMTRAIQSIAGTLKVLFADYLAGQTRKNA